MKKHFILLIILSGLKVLGQNCIPSVSPSASICANSSTSLSASGANTYTWMPGNITGNSITVMPTTTTVYTVTATTSTCVASNTVMVTVYPVPVVDPVANQYYCPNSVTTPIVFSSTSGGSSTTFNWTSSSGIPITGNIPSFTTVNSSSSTLVETISVCATSNGCAGPASNFNIIIYPNPVASFNTSASVCEGQATNFIDNSTPTTGSITVNYWAWDMNNDGVYDVFTQNPQYVFGPAGSNTVTLMVSTNSTPSCTSIVNEAVFINPNPVVNFTSNINVGCSPLLVSFADISTISIGSITSWYWDFGNGSSASHNPSPQVYSNSSSQPIYYTVDLIVRSNNGCTDTVIKHNYIEVDICTGIETFSKNNLQIYPNPASNNLHVTYLNGEVMEIKLIDAFGNELSRNTKQTTIDVSDLQTGVYFVLVKTNEESYTTKFIKE